MKIIFNKKDHKYQVGDEIYTSVSKTISRYKNEFDKEHWSTYKALEKLLKPDVFKALKKGWDVSSSEFLFYALNKAEEYVTPMEIASATKNVLIDWGKTNKQSIDKGNLYHDTRERESYERGYEVNPFDGKNYVLGAETVKAVLNPDFDPEEKQNLVEDLYMLPDGYYPELLIWNKEQLLAGQADKVYLETIDGIRYVDVDDYKTNKKIKTKSHYTRGKGYQMMKGPLSHMMDCNHQHYCLQISLYAWMMEKFGFQVRNLAFHHFDEKYAIDYMKPEIQAIFNIMPQLPSNI